MVLNRVIFRRNTRSRETRNYVHDRPECPPFSKRAPKTGHYAATISHIIETKRGITIQVLNFGDSFISLER